jgi:branched-chain amino acid transport system ATP-binding protein
MTALLEVEGLNSGYGRLEVLHDFEVNVEAGTITAVLGANGAGKSTMLKTLSGLVRPTAGAVRFEGEDITRLPVEELIQRGLTHVPEGGGVIPELTVEENLRLGGLWRKGAVGAKVTAEAIDDVYDLFDRLRERRSYHGHQLSGGERQMLALGRALVARPKMMLLDEPSLGLAPRIVAIIMALLRDLRDEMGMTALLVEQNVGSALSIADEGVVVSVGKVVARGPAADLQSDVKLRHAYLGF